MCSANRDCREDGAPRPETSWKSRPGNDPDLLPDPALSSALRRRRSRNYTADPEAAFHLVNAVSRRRLSFLFAGTGTWIRRGWTVIVPSSTFRFGFDGSRGSRGFRSSYIMNRCIVACSVTLPTMIDTTLLLIIYWKRIRLHILRLSLL